MRKFFKILFVTVISAALAGVFFCVGVNAEEIISERDTQTLSCVVSESGEGYKLTENGESVSEYSSLAELVSYLSAKSVNVWLDVATVSSDEVLVFKKGNITLSGLMELEGEGGIMVEGGTLNISGLALSMENGSIRIKKGTVNMTHGSLSSGGVTVALDYSAAAYLSVSGGSIISTSSSAAIMLKWGSAQITGGNIESAEGVGIENYSTLTLLGTPSIKGGEYDIKTDCPIFLNEEEKEYNGTTRVTFYGEFEKGTSTRVFLCETQKCIENITLYDKNGTVCPLTFFSSDEVEGDGGAFVYLPFSVSMYDGTSLYKTEYALSGERVSAPEPPSKKGYKFSVWTQEGGEPFDFGGGISSDIKLYAKYSLIPPTFSTSSLSFSYDGASREIKITDVSHPLIEEGYISYSWYKNGECIESYGYSHKVLNVSDSGEYTCTITLTVPSESVSVTTPKISVNILKASVRLPAVPEAAYTGVPISAPVYSTDIYTAQSVSGTLAGIYPVKLTLLHPENYEFENTKDSCVFVDFVIAKAANFWLSNPKISDFYTCGSAEPSALSRFGDVVFLYASASDGIFTAEPPVQPGDYLLRATVAGTENYTGLESEPVSFSVIREIPIGISVKTPSEKLVYTAFEYFDPTGLSVTVAHNSGRRTVVYPEQLEFFYQNADSFRFADAGITVSYEGCSVLLPLEIKKAEYDLSQVVFSDVLLVFNGEYRTAAIPSVLPVGADGISLCAAVKGGGTNVGIYPVALEFSTESRDYILPESISATLTVLPYSAPVVWGECSFVYDGDPKLPQAYYLDVYGRKITLSPSGARSFAGEYIATASSADSNYVLTNASIPFSILKADYDMSGVFWCGSGEVYDGKEKEVFLNGLPDGVEVIGYVNNKATYAGKYTANAAFYYDSENYNPPAACEYVWEIIPANYSTEGFAFYDSKVTYDSLTHYPVFEGEMPLGIDGIPLEYSYSCGATHVIEGRVRVEISFFSTSGNYTPPEPIFRYVEIEPMEISVDWQGIEFVYNGSVQAPVATALECSVTVIGGMTDAGEHTASASADNPDYKIINSTCIFFIEKAQNAWSENLSVSDIFYGREPAPSAKAKAGEVEYIYFSAPTLAEPLSQIPRAVGTYYVQAVCSGDKNHFSISSEAVSFSIIAVIPVQLSVVLSKTDFYAFDKITQADVSAHLLNNDGSISELTIDDMVIDYHGADSFRYGDSSVSFLSSGFIETVSVSVQKAVLDMSAVKWENTLIVYDGTEKSAYLTGLPEGVSVEEYIGNTAVTAGEYKVSARLEYDKANYEPPIIPEATLIIAKKTVAAPEIPTVLYNGKGQAPEIPESEFYTAQFTGTPTKAGAYSVVFTLVDSHNYSFVGAESSISVDFIIERIPLTVKVANAELNLFEDEITPSFTVVRGALIKGDFLVPVYRIVGDKIYADFDSENYEITVIEGDIIHTGKLSAKTLSFILLMIFLLIAIILITVVVIKNRRRFCAVYTAYEPLVKEEEKPPFEESTKNEPSAEESDSAEEEAPHEPIPQEEAETVSDPVSKEYADSAITDSLARDLIRRDVNVETNGTKRGIVNVDTLSRSFCAGDKVDINDLKEHSLIPYDTAYIKVLARGIIDKPLRVYANDFSLAAVKMIALTGGKAIKVNTVVVDKECKNQMNLSKGIEKQGEE